MAAVRLKCTFFGYFSFFCALLVAAKANNEFVYYQVDEHRSMDGIPKENIILLERSKRYVETYIPRLADNYNRQDSYPTKNLDKDDLDTFSRRRGRMEMLGNLAVNAADFAKPLVNPGDSLKLHRQVTETVPEKPTKKPTGTGAKKNSELSPGKALPSLDDKIHNVSTQESSGNKATSVAVNATATVPPPIEKPDFNVEEHSFNSTSSDHHLSTHHEVIKDKTEVEDGNAHGDYTGGGDGRPNTDFTEADFPKDITNNTLIKNNITEKQVDHHTYYNSTFIVDATIAKQFWVIMDNERDVVLSKILSESHRRATTVKLSFEFPFYGHLVQKLTIATGGFLYTGDYIHSWLAATQYIAPLMANFDTGLSDDSRVRYMDNGTAFTVEWDRVHLQDKPEAGQFTFQATLHKNGDIVFVYKDVPILIEHIEDCQHPVKIGLSDAYIIDRTVFFVRRKTIYEYHRVNFKREDIRNWTVIYMTALPTCRNFTDCKSCISKDTVFDCKWCAAVNRCSSGFDRHRQEWQLKQCEHSAINSTDLCELPGTNVSTVFSERHQQINNGIQKSKNIANSQAATDTILGLNKQSGLGHSGLLGLLFFVLIISCLSLWLLYAYRNPHTTSGQVLIKYRPSQWTLRRGEARYTAASIHM